MTLSARKFAASAFQGMQKDGDEDESPAGDLLQQLTEIISMLISCALLPS